MNWKKYLWVDRVQYLFNGFYQGVVKYSVLLLSRLTAEKEDSFMVVLQPLLTSISSVLLPAADSPGFQ